MELKLEACLISGINYTMDNGIEIINHKLGTVYRVMMVEKYYSLLRIINFDKEELKDSYAEEEIDYFIFCSTVDLLENFLVCSEVKYHKNFNEYLVYINEEEYIRVNKKCLLEIFEILKKMYCISESKDKDEDYKYQDEQTRKMFEEFFEEEKQRNANKKPVLTVSSIIEYICSKHNSINILNIWDLTMYQLHRCYLRREMIDNYELTLSGIYSGTIDSKNIQLDKIRPDKVITD